jgi:hypothetical protein
MQKAVPILSAGILVVLGWFIFQPSRLATGGSDDTPHTVTLGARRTASADAGQRWELHYPEGKPAQAEVVLELGPYQSASSGPFAFARAVLRRRGGADPSAFVNALAVALGVDSTWPKRPRADLLTIDVGILGSGMARGGQSSQGNWIAGEFSDAQSGTWLVTKLFLADGEAEVFLALSEEERQGLLIGKDVDYGQTAVAELARLF